MNKIRTLQWFLLLSVAFVMFSCKSKYGIPEDKMAAILVEFHMADGLITSQLGQGIMLDSTKYYEPILKKYGYTLADFRTSLNLYMNNPIVFDKVYGKVTDQLKEMQAVLTPPPSQASYTATDSVAIPQHESSYPYWHYEISVMGDTTRICW